MKSIEIENIKYFTTQLFAGMAFDTFLTTEASFRMAVDYQIDGHLNPEFIGEEEMNREENREGIACWKWLRPVCFTMIKGKKVPLQFKIVFRMPNPAVEQFLEQTGLSVSADQIGGLFLNVHFKDGRLSCITGVSQTSFSLDRSLEEHWDSYMTDFLKPYLGKNPES